MQTGAVMSPWRRIAWFFVGFLGGTVLAAIVAGVVLAASDFEVDVSAAIGSDAGRTAMQIADELPLDDHRIPLGLAAVLQVPLWAGMLGAPLLARHQGLRWRRDLGLRMRWSDVPIGLGVGVVLQLVVVPLLYVPIFEIFGDQDLGEVARQVLGSVDGWFDVVAAIVMVGIGAPVVEEIFFRGLLHRALADQFSPARSAGAVAAVVLSSLVFAAAHFQLLQFPALFVVGVVTATFAQLTDRIGGAIWTHIGFNGTTLVVLLFL